MIALVLSLPFYTVNVFADNTGIVDASIYDDYNVPNFVGRSGLMTYNILATYGDDRVVGVENIELTVGGAERRMTFCINEGGCVSEEGNYRCTCVHDWVPDEVWSFTFRLYDENNQRVGSHKTVNLYPDILPPAIQDFATRVTEKQLTVNYRIEDEACDEPLCNGKCSGIKDIEFYIDGGLAHTEEINTNANDCISIGQWSHEFSTEGSHTIYALAHDNMNNYVRIDEEEVFIDVTSPGVSERFKIEKNNREIPYFISTVGPYSHIDNVDVVVTINEANELKEVYADLSNLNMNYQAYGYPYTNKIGIIQNQESEQKKVLFKNVPRIDKNDCGNTCNFEIIVWGEDVNGNTFRVTASRDMRVDNSGPSIVSFRTNYCDADKCYVKKEKNRLSLKLDEQGIGMNYELAVVNIRSFDQTKYADPVMLNCEHLPEGLWECHGMADLKITDADDKNGDIIFARITDGTMDDLGNIATGERVWEFTGDTVAPDIRDIEILDNDGMEVLRPNHAITIRANIIESVSGIKEENAIAEMDYLITNKGNITAAQCSLNEAQHKYSCVWTYSGPLEPGNAQIRITAIDNAGNSNSAIGPEPPAYVAGLKEGEPNFWEAEADVDPGPDLNKNFLTLSQGTYQAVEVELEPKDGSSKYVHRLAVTGNSCTGNVANKDPYTVTVDVMPKPATEDDGITAATLIVNLVGFPTEREFRAAIKPDELDELNLTCEIEIVQGNQRRGYIYTTNEKVNATIKIKLLPGVYSDPGAGLMDKIRSHKSDIETLTDITGVLDTILKFLGSWCPATNAVRQIMASAGTIICTISWWTGPGGGSTCEWVTMQSAKLNTLWYGKETYDEETGLRDTKPNEGLWIGLSPYKIVSLGFMCQLYLCNECTGWFDETFSKWSDSMSGGDWDWLESDGGNLANLQTQLTDEQIEDGINFYDRNNDGQIGLGDIQNNIILSATCVPPCLTGINNVLHQWKSILIQYNVCLNEVEYFGSQYSDQGTLINTDVCDEFVSSMKCQLVWGQIWMATLGRWAQAAVHTFIYKIVDKTIFKIARKCGDKGGLTDWVGYCWPAVILDTYGIYQETVKIGESIETLKGSNRDEDDDKKLKDDTKKVFETDPDYWEGDPFDPRREG